jgi:hypothetical protein
VAVIAPRERTSTDRRLEAAAVFFAIAVLVHNSDHVRRGAQTLHLDVFVAGTSAIVLEVALVVLPVMRHRVAPLAAAVGGFALAAGYVVTHFLPAHPVLSDSFVSKNVSPLSWFAASLEVVAALTLGIVGLRTLRERGGLVSAAANRDEPPVVPLRTALLHPAVLALVVGNAVILVISVAQRLG